jgi:hypothetical protein
MGVIVASMRCGVVVACRHIGALGYVGEGDGVEDEDGWVCLPVHHESGQGGEH